MPAGIGLHPFFVRDADCTLTCRTAAVWRTDAEVLPVERIAVPAEWDFCARRAGSTASCSTTASTAGTAARRSPGRGRRLRLDLEATQPFRHLVIYTPAGQRFFCVEPVSHANGQVGLAPLGAGRTLAGEVVFPSFHPVRSHA